MNKPNTYRISHWYVNHYPGGGSIGDYSVGDIICSFGELPVCHKCKTFGSNIKDYSGRFSVIMTRDWKTPKRYYCADHENLIEKRTGGGYTTDFIKIEEQEEDKYEKMRRQLLNK